MNDNTLCIYHQFSDFAGNRDWEQGRQSISCSALLLIISLLWVRAHPSAEKNPFQLQLIMQHPQLKVATWKLVLAFNWTHFNGIKRQVLLSFSFDLVNNAPSFCEQGTWAAVRPSLFPLLKLVAEKVQYCQQSFEYRCVYLHQQGDHCFFGVLHRF